MTDQDNLRERIERQLCMFFDENYDGHLFDASQAIIDELRLTVETHAATHSKRAMTRIIGEWEWDN